MRRCMIHGSIVLLLATGGPAALAQGFGPPGPPGPPPPPLLVALGDLDLSADQREAIHRLLREARVSAEAQHAAVHDADQEIDSIVRTSGYDATLLAPLAEAKGAALAELTLLHAEVESRVRELLGPGQSRALDARLDDLRRPGGFGPPHGGPARRDSRSHPLGSEGRR